MDVEAPITQIFAVYHHYRASPPHGLLGVFIFSSSNSFRAGASQSSHPCDLLDDADGWGNSQQTTVEYFLKSFFSQITYYFKKK